MVEEFLILCINYLNSYLDFNFNIFNLKIYRNGDIYQGQWKNNIKQGKGNYISKGICKYSGLWKNDQIYQE